MMNTMASSERKRRNTASLQPDSIDMTRPHLPRDWLLSEVEAQAREKQYVIIGGPPATGKSSFLELLRHKMEKAGDEVVSIDIINTRDAPNTIFSTLASHSVLSNRNETVEAFKAKKNGFWLLIDEAQNGYSTQFEPLWSFLFKTVVKYGLKDKLFVIVASTYDETLGVSPVHFRGHHHFSPHITEQEARILYQLHTEEWYAMSTWSVFCDTLLSLSWIVNSNVEGDNSRFHIGVVIAGIYLLQPNFKNQSYRENDGLQCLRSTVMISNLDRCFAKPKELSRLSKKAIVDNLMRGHQIEPDFVIRPSLPLCPERLAERVRRIFLSCGKLVLHYSLFPWLIHQRPNNTGLSCRPGCLIHVTTQTTKVQGPR